MTLSERERAEVVAFHNATHGYKPSIEERKFYAAQRAEREAREQPKKVGRDPKTIRRPLPGQSLMIPHLLRSGIFAVSEKTAAKQRKVPLYDDVSNTEKGASVEYTGAHLRQYDLRVLLGLMVLAGGLHCEKAVITFHAESFFELIGKDLSTASVEALRDSLRRLRAATFTVRNFAKDKGVIFGFIDSVAWEKRQFTVTLSPAMHQAFDVLRFRQLPLEVRNRLADGVQTALADIVYSTSAEAFDIEDLAVILGREPEWFGKEVRAAMERLVEAGVLTSWWRTCGRVHVKRAAE